jgi:hypothetical protein
VAALLLTVPGSARADWIVAALLGHAATLPGTINLALPDRGTSLELDGVHYRGESFASPQYYTLRLTWVPDQHPWLGLEGEFLHAKVFAETTETVRMRGTLRGAPIDATLPLASVVQRLAMSHGLNFILANVAVRREAGPRDARGLRRLALVARAGAGPTKPHAESTVDHVNVDQYQSGGIGAQMGGGVEITLWRGLQAVGEYKFTWATPEIEVAGGSARIPARSHHAAFGVGYHF